MYNVVLSFVYILSVPLYNKVYLAEEYYERHTYVVSTHACTLQPYWYNTQLPN